MKHVGCGLCLILGLTAFAHAEDRFRPFSMAAYSLTLPVDVIVSNRYGDDYTIYDFRTRERYLFSAFVGNFPNTSILPIPEQTDSFSFQFYPQQQAHYWNCGDKKKWKCLRKELYFPQVDYASSIQFFYDEVSPAAAAMANSIIKTLQAPAVVEAK